MLNNNSNLAIPNKLKELGLGVKELCFGLGGVTLGGLGALLYKNTSKKIPPYNKHLFNEFNKVKLFEQIPKFLKGKSDLDQEIILDLIKAFYSVPDNLSTAIEVMNKAKEIKNPEDILKHFYYYVTKVAEEHPENSPTEIFKCAIELFILQFNL